MSEPDNEIQTAIENKTAIFIFLDYISRLSYRASEQASTIEEVEEVKRVLFGKNGLYVEISKQVGLAYKEKGSRPDD